MDHTVNERDDVSTPSQPGDNDPPNSYLAEAVWLARRGDYDRASHYLQRALDAGECAAVEALHLEARIYAQQGRHLDAEACWLKALKLDPGHVGCRRALERLQSERTPIYRLRQLVLGLLALAMVAFVVLYVGQVHTEWRFRQDALDSRIALTQDQISQAHATLGRALADMNRLQSVQMEALSTKVEDASETQRQAQTALSGKLTNCLDRAAEGQQQLTTVLASMDAAMQKVVEHGIGALEARLDRLQEQATAVGAVSAERERVLLTTIEKVMEAQQAQIAAHSEMQKKSIAVDVDRQQMEIVKLMRDLVRLMDTTVPMKGRAADAPSP